jgi:cyclopropane fatty-acyl-phospholipid synthase-like methyltransferase
MNLVGDAESSELTLRKRNIQIQFLQEKGLTASDYLLDFGCGVLRGGIPLIDFLENSHYVGVDISEERLKEGEAELRAQGLEHKSPILLVDTPPYVKIVDLEMKFDFIWSYQTLIHMNDEILDSLFKIIPQLLKPSGEFYATASIGSKQRDGTWVASRSRSGRKWGHWQEFPMCHRTLPCYEQLAEKYKMKTVHLEDYHEDGQNVDCLNFTTI